MTRCEECGREQGHRVGCNFDRTDRTMPEKLPAEAWLAIGTLVNTITMKHCEIRVPFNWRNEMEKNHRGETIEQFGRRMFREATNCLSKFERIEREGEQ